MTEAVTDFGHVCSGTHEFLLAKCGCSLKSKISHTEKLPSDRKKVTQINRQVISIVQLEVLTSAGKEAKEASAP